MILSSAVVLTAGFIGQGIQPTQDIHITEAIFMSGLVHAESVLASQDAVIQASGDLMIVTTGPIQIDGKIIGWDGNELQPDAGEIRLVSMDSITINGELIPGRGADGSWVGDPGGNGGDIYVESPITLIGFDNLIGGNGGQGGPSASGGDGGDVIVIGGIARTDRRPASFTGGVPGRGGDGVNGFGRAFRIGGDGGNGGDALQFLT